MSTPGDLAAVVGRLVDNATSTWTGTLRLTIILAALAATPAAIIVLIVLAR